jgi:hypothetical protein
MCKTTLLKQAIKHYMEGYLSFYCLTEIIFEYYGWFDGASFTSDCKQIRAKVVGNERVIFCFQ